MKGIEDQETKEKLMKIDEDLMATFIRKWQELFEKLSEGTTEKSKDICLKTVAALAVVLVLVCFLLHWLQSFSAFFPLPLILPCDTDNRRKFTN
ncbi:hypothetical protein SLEP1_g53262 [Rubroshorea leprosula]|uniref:Transmembrane protein n=1 Tax=Rubroshorea leprosula TaxID=152421 RepID=A0AAV5M8W1_9ROSI|nr:hypothetical protein SLEP1_g53262 [Rubroshorea leprosula]